MAKPDGLLVVPPDARARVPAPPRRRRALGRRAEDDGQAARARHHARSARWPRSTKRCSWPCSDRHPVTTCTRSRTTATPVRSTPGAAAARWARSGRSGAAVVRRTRCGRCSTASSTASRVACARLVSSVTPSCCASASTTSPAPRARARCPRRPPTPRRCATPARRLLDHAQSLVETRGLTLVGVSVTNLSDADAVQLPLPFDGGQGPALDHALDAVRERFGSSAVGRGRAARQGPRLVDAVATRRVSLPPPGRPTRSRPPGRPRRTGHRRGTRRPSACRRSADGARAPGPWRGRSAP